MGTEPRGEPLRVNVRSVVGAELGHDPAEDATVSAAGAGLLGSAQGRQVGVCGAAESHLIGGAGDAADCSHALSYQR